MGDKHAKKWLSKLGISVSIILVVMMLFSYIMDPFLHYRIGDNKYFLNSRFVTYGLLKNYDYDTVIIGSSMIQNFNMQSFRDKLDYNPVKATIGGMNVCEIEMMNKLVNNTDKAERVIISLDMTEFNDKVDENRFPSYLYDESKFNDYKYLLGYETWIKYMPRDVAINSLYKMQIDIPFRYVRMANPDYLSDWSLNCSFGSDIVKNQYINGMHLVSNQDNEKMYDNMNARFEKFIVEVELDSEKEYIFLFPPYSALYWYYVDKLGYRDDLIEFKKNIVKELDKYDNVRIVDMQDIEDISDLDHYKDITHFDTTVQEKIVDAIKDMNYDVTIINIDDKINKMLELVDEFENKNKEWL